MSEKPLKRIEEIDFLQPAGVYFNNLSYKQVDAEESDLIEIDTAIESNQNIGLYCNAVRTAAERLNDYGRALREWYKIIPEDDLSKDSRASREDLIVVSSPMSIPDQGSLHLTGAAVESFRKVASSYLEIFDLETRAFELSRTQFALDLLKTYQARPPKKLRFY